MATFNLESLWEVMKIFNFQTVTDIDSEMLCVFCKKLLINAHITECGCRFCFACISDYLNEEVRQCPGNTNDCQLTISLDKNIGVDNSANIKISKMKVKCPHKSCEFNDELKKMSDHLQICNYRSVDCPFINIGCNKFKISHDKMLDHLQSEVLMHTKLMMDFVDNVNNKIHSVDKRLLEMEINENKVKYGYFVWKIEKFSDKMADAKFGINTIVYSNSFLTHKNGYKMCLCVYPDGDGDGKGTHLSVCFCLMKGDFDDILEWPFKHEVTFELICQQTRLAHVIYTTKYEKNKAHDRPTDRTVGFPKFLSLAELSTNPNLIQNDQIFIKCTINI